MEQKPVILIGGGGHAKVLADTLRLLEIPILGIVDPQLSHSPFFDIPCLGSDEAVFDYSPDKVNLVNGIGSVCSLANRKRVYEKFKHHHYTFQSVIHPSAVIASQVQLGEGVQLMAGSVLQVGVHLGNNSLVNTAATVDHDSQVGHHVHIGPGVTISGSVLVQDEVHIGCGAVIIQQMTVGFGAVIAAGAVVVSHVNSKVLVQGVPAKERDYAIMD